MNEQNGWKENINNCTQYNLLFCESRLKIRIYLKLNYLYWWGSSLRIKKNFNSRSEITNKEEKYKYKLYWKKLTFIYDELQLLVAMLQVQRLTTTPLLEIIRNWLLFLEFSKFVFQVTFSKTKQALHTMNTHFLN